jgi:hypothetical protein
MPGADDPTIATGPAAHAAAHAAALPRFVHRSPYPGLRPFEDHEFDLFFGRTDQVDEIIDRILTTHFASILGGSGCGKSSLVRAGVIPELRFRGDTWLQVVFNAGQRPLSRLADALSAVLVKGADDAGRTSPEHLKRLLTQQNGLAAVVDEFREDFIVRVRPDPPDGQAPGDDDADRRRLSANAKLLILIDQFEEVFRAENEAERLEAAQIVRLIVDSFELRHPSVYLVLAMRSEDLHSCTAYLDLPRVINRSSYLVRRLDDAEIGQAIVEPARYCRQCMLTSPHVSARRPGAAEFDPELVRRLREEVRLMRDDVDHLPLLQHALFRLWEAALARERAGAGGRNGDALLIPQRVTLADLESATGGPASGAPSGGSLLRRCVEIQANRLYDALDPREQRVAECAFRLLGTVDENRLIKRRRTTVAEITSTAPRGATAAVVGQVVDRFRTPHPYLRVQGDDIDVSHEAFIRNWKQFGDWVRNEAMRRQCYAMLLDRLRQWQASYQDSSASRLTRAARWFRDLLDRHARAEASAYGIARLEPARVAKYLREIGVEPAVAAGPPTLHSEVLRFLGLSRRRARATWGLFALLVVAPLVLYGLALVEGRQRADLDREAKAFQSLVVSSTSGNAQHALLPLEERTMRLWEVLAAVRARGSRELDDAQDWATPIMSWLGLDSRDRRLMRAVRLSGRQAQDALRSILTSSVWPTRAVDDDIALQAELPAPAEIACMKGPDDATRGTLMVSAEDATRRLFFVRAENAIYVAETGATGGCRIGQPLLRVAGRADVRADPALRTVVEMSNAGASQDGAAAPAADGRSPSALAYSFYRVRWSCVSSAAGGAACAAWNAELVRAGSFETQLAHPRAWGVTANGSGFKVIEGDGTKRRGMEFAAPFDPVSPASAADVTRYFSATADVRDCVARLESAESPVRPGTAIVAPVTVLREAKYCAEIGSLSATDQVVNVYALPVSWETTIANEARAAAARAPQAAARATDQRGDAMTPKQHLVRFPVASFAFQAPAIRRAAFGEQELEGYLVLETADGRHFKLLWDLDHLYRKGCDVLYQPALVNHLDRVEYTTQGHLRNKRRPVHPVVAFLTGSSEEGGLEKVIGSPCDTGTVSMPAQQR